MPRIRKPGQPVSRAAEGQSGLRPGRFRADAAMRDAGRFDSTRRQKA